MTPDEEIAELLNHLSSPSQSHWHRAVSLLRERLGPCSVCMARNPRPITPMSGTLTTTVPIYAGLVPSRFNGKASA